MNIRMIGLDLDHTTLNNSGYMSEKTKSVLKKAIEKGIYVVIATGRSYYSMPDDVRNFEGIIYTANSNGAEIRERKTGNVIYRNCINQQAVTALYEFVKSSNAVIEVFTDGKAYIGRKEYDDIVSGRNPFRAREYVIKTRSPVDDIFEFLLMNKNSIENINMFFSSDEEKNRIWKMSENLSNVTVTSSLPDNIEIGGATTSKASALLYLAEKLEISENEIMCCGDSLNDMQMLKVAGFSVAMGNASDELKKIADYVTETNENDGVALAIEKFVIDA